MYGLRCDRSEAEKVYEDDLRIDKGERMDFDFDKAKEKAIMNETHIGMKKLNLPAKSRKPNETKGAIIAELAAVLESSAENAYSDIKIVNKEREIEFHVGETSFSLTLIQHRAPKKPK